MKLDLKARVKRLGTIETKTTERLRSARDMRLAAAAVFVVLIIAAAIWPKLGLAAPVLIGFTIVFAILVRRTRQLETFQKRIKALAAFYLRQDRRRQGEAVERNWPAAQSLLADDEERTLAQDLNLIGPHSLFTLIDETVSDGGQSALVDQMLRPTANAESIRSTQKRVQEFSRDRWLFIRLLVAAGESEMELSTHQTLEFVKKPLLPSSATRWLLITVLAWLAALIGIFWSFISGSGSASVFFLAYVLIGFYAFNRIGPVFLRGVGLSQNLEVLVRVFGRLETKAKDPLYRSSFPNLIQRGPARALRRFNFVLGFLSAEAHPLIYMILNAITPWAVVFSWWLERRRLELAEHIPACLEEFHRLEALMSLCFLKIYQTQTMPEFIEASGAPPAPTSADVKFEVNEVFHPLIDRSRVVANSFSFTGGKTLGLITGSNMAGKSTFLRTIGVNQILALMGAPVFATRFRTSVFRVGSCIQVSDSLRDGFSYFYSEVLHLKRLIEQVRSGVPTLYLIDEIFRGTNNRERQIGSRAVIRGLSQNAASVGFVSTHDLELTHLEEELKAVLNLHFREEIRGEQMLFSYQLHPGPCPTTNALVIMRQAGLEV